MIGMNPETGRWVTGLDQFYFRLKKALMTPLGSEIKRLSLGSKASVTQDKNQSISAANDLRAYTVAAINHPANGLQDFKLNRVLVAPGETGFKFGVQGVWRGELINYTLPPISFSE